MARTLSQLRLARPGLHCVGGCSGKYVGTVSSAYASVTGGCIYTWVGRVHGSGPRRWTPVGVACHLGGLNGYVQYATSWSVGDRRRGGNQIRCALKVFSSGMENVGGWLKVTPKLARPNWQLDSSACKNGKGRGTRETGAELVVGLQCLQEREGERDTGDRGRTGSWTPVSHQTGQRLGRDGISKTRARFLPAHSRPTSIVSAVDSDAVHRREVDLRTHFTTDKVSETSIELAVGLQCRRDRPRQLDSDALSHFFFLKEKKKPWWTT